LMDEHRNKNHIVTCDFFSLALFYFAIYWKLGVCQKDM
jgi:hypothetical protein